MINMHIGGARQLCVGAAVGGALLLGADIVGFLAGNAAVQVPVRLHSVVLCLILVAVAVGVIRMTSVQTARRAARTNLEIRELRAQMTRMAELVSALVGEVHKLRSEREGGMVKMVGRLDEIAAHVQQPRPVSMADSIEDSMARAHISGLFEEYRADPPDGLPGLPDGLPKPRG